ncbi:hypothetical protein HYFRA_00008152 [Hymenoscyphus fraxineus]|uniref:Alpha/beta hydrolase fold-3 domain-containing protein n=1 Tax=Hymenoscyphus fraxineus TaxID=746836 RepID=A0A9N9L9H6_9HELO|nr:hypothetical protein HYFRA_00008152 [Hymenoscyphus fraxineus]
MDTSIYGILRNIAPVLILAIKTAILAFFGLSPNADVQDIATEIITTLARPILGTPASLLKSQIQLNYDWGVRGRIWLAKCCVSSFHGVSDFEAGQQGGVVGLKTALRLAIEELGDGTDIGSEGYKIPEIVDVEAEWVGYRGGVWHTAKRPDLSERAQYEAMMKEVKEKNDGNAPTMLYLHGGAMWCVQAYGLLIHQFLKFGQAAFLMDPATHRWPISDLAKAASGRCFSVRYRLSPQSVFPAALLDAMMCYLYLISPPPDSFHKPVPHSQIVIAADSSGGGIAASLVLLLLTLPRIGITHIRFANQDVPIPITQPVAGLAITSPWLDISRSLPSVTRNARYDIIAPPTPLQMTPNFPPDKIWPASPPRVETYCVANMVSHPLVSPLAAKSKLWKGAPPLYLCVGWESMQDEGEVFARRFHEAGSVVYFRGYVGMPHCFGMVPWNWMGRKAMRDWGEFCKSVVGRGEEITSSAFWTGKDGQVTEVDPQKLGFEIKGLRPAMDDGFVEMSMKEQKRWRVVAENEMRAQWWEKRKV